MALEINITVNAPDLSAALNNFANTITSMMVAGATYPEETAKEIKRAVKPDEKTISPEEATKIREFLKQDAAEKGVEAPKPPAAEPATPAAESATPKDDPNAIIDKKLLPTIRATVAAYCGTHDNGKENIRAWLKEHGFEGLGKLTYAGAEEFTNFLREEVAKGA